MKRFSPRKIVAAVSVSLIAVALLINGVQRPSQASSHREAPLIVADPLIDNTDTYAFRSYEPGREGFVTLIANYIPFEVPSGGPHYYKFDDTALYEIKIDNTGDGVADITYQFRFTNKTVNEDIVLGAASPTEALTGKGGVEPLITSLTDPDYNEVQMYSVTRVDHAGKKMLAHSLLSPPNNVGVRSTPNYETLAQHAVNHLPNGGRVFAGQRDEGFYIDVASIFDTLNLRSISDKGGVDYTAGFNVHSIALEVPIKDLTRDGKMPKDTTAQNAVIGVWSTASRQTTQVIRSAHGNTTVEGEWKQVSRLGNPLVNEVVIPLKLKNAFNTISPKDDAVAAPFVLDPQLPKLLKAVFKIDIPPAPRTDLVAIFATGIKAGSVPGAPHYNTFLSDGTPHEMLRLNVAIPPTPMSHQSRLGLLGGDLAGFPNGRRVGDDVTDIALRAMAGGTPFTPATNVAPNNTLGDGVSENDVPYLHTFPYLGTPHPGRAHQ
jgi:hypothetical protein